MILHNYKQQVPSHQRGLAERAGTRSSYLCVTLQSWQLSSSNQYWVCCRSRNPKAADWAVKNLNGLYFWKLLLLYTEQAAVVVHLSTEIQSRLQKGKRRLGWWIWSSLTNTLMMMTYLHFSFWRIPPLVFPLPECFQLECYTEGDHLQNTQTHR